MEGLRNNRKTKSKKCEREHIDSNSDKEDKLEWLII